MDRTGIRRFYLTFPFGHRAWIGIQQLEMWRVWVEVKAHTRQRAIELANERFRAGSFWINGEEGFTPERREFYPDGCCLVIMDHD